MNIFVYGTLRRGEPNHTRMRDAKFIATTQTEPCYELVDFGEYPAMIEGGSMRVRGEIYDVDERLLAELDDFEDVPDLYVRKPVKLMNGHADAFVMRRELTNDVPRVASGDWASCRS